MKSPVILVALAALAISSCTSAYKTGQTPDDVYYSPVRAQDEYVQVDKKDDRYYRNTDQYYEDRYLRMRVQNRYQWSYLDDYYFNSPYAYNYSFYGSSWSNPYNNYWCWNNYYNPYYSGSHYYYGYGPVVAYPTKAYSPPPSRPIVFNRNSYGPGNTNAQGNRISNSYIPSNSGPRYNNSNSSNSNTFGNTLRKVFSNSNSSSSYPSNSNSSTPSRSYNPSSSSSSSSSSSRSSSSGSSSSGSMSRPGR